MSDTIIAGIIVASLAVTMGGLTFSLMLWVWSDFQDWRDKRNRPPIERVRAMQKEWEANGKQRLTTEPQPFEKYSHYFAGQLRKALDGEQST